MNATPSLQLTTVCVPCYLPLPLSSYPASSTYVLAVAETQFLRGATNINQNFDQSITSPPEVSRPAHTAPLDHSPASLLLTAVCSLCVLTGRCAV